MIRLVGWIFPLIAMPLTLVHAADVYPSKTIRIIVPYPPGGNADITARTIAPGLSEVLAQSVLVENRSGANGAIGTEFAARSAPDGYTLLLGTSGSITNGPALSTKLGYDPIKDFATTSMVAIAIMVVAVHPSVPVWNVKELIALAKSRPGKLTYGSSGAGSSDHLGAELLQSMTGTSLTHVPYKGGGPALTDVLGGQIDILFTHIIASSGYIQSGKLRALAVTAKKRAAQLPDVPTVDESGAKGFEAFTFSGVMLPVATPRNTVMKVHEALTRVLRLKTTQDAFNRLGGEFILTTPEEFSSFIRDDLAKWTKLVRALGIKHE